MSRQNVSLVTSSEEKKNNPDSLETSFINTANILKEYVLEKKENEKKEKENLSANEYLAKFILSFAGREKR